MHVCERMYTEHFVIYAYTKTQFMSKTVMFSVRQSTTNDTILETEMFTHSKTDNRLVFEQNKLTIQCLFINIITW